MKKILVMGVAVVMAIGVSAAFAGGSCCPAKAKAAAKAGCGADWAKCSDTFAKVDLTAEQKAKIADLEKACAAEGKTKEACEKYQAEMKKVLTADQLAAYEAACKEKAAASDG